MKKIVLSLLFIIFILVSSATFHSCRKGENDPFLSLRTRKARITGLWKLSEGFYTYSSPGIYNLEIEYDGENATERLNGSFKQAYDYRIEFKINKDYTFERVTVENRFSRTEKGNWFFNKKSKKAKLKNKEAIILSITSIESSGQSSSSTGVSADEIILIDRLKNDEVIFKGERTFTGSTTDTETYDYTYLKF